MAADEGAALLKGGSPGPPPRHGTYAWQEMHWERERRYEKAGLRPGVAGEDSASLRRCGRRRRTLVLASAAMCVVLLCLVLYVMEQRGGPSTSRRHRTASGTGGGDGGGCGSADADGFRTCEYDASALLAFDRVAALVGNESSRLLPKRVSLSFSASEMEQEIGADGAAGYVVFSLFRPSVASYLVVVACNGTIARVAPTTWVDGGSAPSRFEAVKMVDPSTVLAATTRGQVYTWAWRSGGDLERVVDGTPWGASGFDVQLSVDGRSVWQPNGSHFVRATRNGTVEASYLVPNCTDMNHVQLVENETRAVVSCRGESSVVSYDLDERAATWVAGGAHGTLALKMDGVAYAAGQKLWSGQHNAEYVGEDSYLLFDNGFGANRSSRLLGLKVQNSRAVVESAVEYVHEFPYGYSPVYGDHDRLPSDNLLGVWWPALKSPSRDLTFDVRVAETTRDGSPAWSLDVFGYRDCAQDGGDDCAQTRDEGWKVYSAERFMDRPIVHGASYSDGQLAFYAHAPLKSNHLHRGRWSLRTDATELDESRDIAVGLFQFAAYWQQTYLVRELAPTTPWGYAICVGNATMSVHVWDEWGAETISEVQCVTGGMA